jgi:hypothetical protein
MKNTKEVKKKHVPKAQTTRLASFGPVSLVVALPNPLVSCPLFRVLVVGDGDGGWGMKL